MTARLARMLRRFAGNRSGNIALMFGLLVLPLIGIVGAAIDYSQAYRAKERVQNALDASSLAVNRMLGRMDENGLRQLAHDTFAANMSDREGATLTQVDISTETREVTLAASTSVPTVFMSVLGFHYLPVAATSTTISGKNTFEIAMVLDNSGSMSGRKLRDLRDAAELLVDMVFAGDTDSDTSLIGVVPFAGSVNVGPQYANASWMDTAGVSPVHSENFTEDANRFELFDRFANVSWAGCVEARPQPLDVDDTTPSAGMPESYFVPMFAPDEPDGQSNTVNNYLDDMMEEDDDDRRGRGRGRGGRGGRGGGGGDDDEWTWEEAQGNIDKYYNGVRADISRAGNTYTGPNYLCTTTPLTPLTGQRRTIDDALDDMQAFGLTNIHQGLMWGWRVLSPQPPFDQGRPMDEEKNFKVIVLMTDGQNTHQGINSPNKSIYTPYGFAANARLRPPTSSTSALVEMMDERTKRACRNAKNAGIRIYTIAFQVSNGGTRQMLEQCATSRDKYFTPENGSELVAAFEAIGKELSQLRIAR